MGDRPAVAEKYLDQMASRNDSQSFADAASSRSHSKLTLENSPAKGSFFRPVLFFTRSGGYRTHAPLVTVVLPPLRLIPRGAVAQHFRSASIAHRQFLRNENRQENSGVA